MTGKLAIFAQAPNRATQIMTTIALGKTIDFSREYFDGTQGGSESRSGTEEYRGEQLESTRISSDYYEQLNWKTLYKTVTIRGRSTVGDEEAYVVVKTPEKGPTVVDYISARSFLLVKRETEGSGGATFYSDYRNVDGEMIAFTSVMQSGDDRIVGRVQEVKFNTSIPPSTFLPTKRPR